MKHLLLFLLLIVVTLPAFAQETFHIGQMVQTADGHQCRIEAITGRSARVRCGPSRSDIRVYSFDSLSSRVSEQQQNQETQAPINSRPAASRIEQPQRQPVQTTTFHVGDTVTTAEGRQGTIESFNGEVAKVKTGPGANDSQYLVVQDLKKVEAVAKETFRVGDRVVDAGGGQGTIEAINGNSAKIRYGNGKYDFKNDLLANLKNPNTAALEAEQAKQRKIFRVEALPFFDTTALFEQFYSPEFAHLKGGIDEAALAKGAAQLAGLDALCKSKYPGITNAAGETDSAWRFGDWCGMAEQRVAVLKKAKSTWLATGAIRETQSWTLKITESMRNHQGYVKDDLQMLVYDRPAWENKNADHIRKLYAAQGETMPADSFATLYKKADELKAQIERDAPTREWTEPPYTDVALEASVKRAYPASVPGVKVFKTGMNFTTWKAMDDTSIVESGTDYKLYRTILGAYRFKLGLALVKLPNQPFCQIRDFQFTQHKAGAGYGAAELSRPIGYTGIFVKCP